jgi:hypothetical protein
MRIEKRSYKRAGTTFEDLCYGFMIVVVLGSIIAAISGG